MGDFRQTMELNFSEESIDMGGYLKRQKLNSFANHMEKQRFQISHTKFWDGSRNMLGKITSGIQIHVTQKAIQHTCMTQVNVVTKTIQSEKNRGVCRLTHQHNHQISRVVIQFESKAWQKRMSNSQNFSLLISRYTLTSQ